MTKRILGLGCLLLAILMTLLVPSVGVQADTLYVRKVVSIVYDDSGSMDQKGSMNWSYANYAIQTLCGLLNSNDELYITYMSAPDTAVKIQGLDTDRQGAVNHIRETIDDGDTPQQAIATAQNKLLDQYSANKNSAQDMEYWLVILTDGMFNGDGTFGKPELDASLLAFAQSGKSSGMDVHVEYLAIGNSAIEANSDPSNNIDSRKCNNGSDIVSALSDLSNLISGRYRLGDGDIEWVNDSTLRISSRVPLNSIAILSQNSSASLASVATDSGASLSTIDSVAIQYPEHDTWTTDTTLKGTAILVGNSGSNIPAGTYTLTFSQAIDRNALDIMLEPALELHLEISRNGTPVTDFSTLGEQDVIDVRMWVSEFGTDKEIDVSLIGVDVTSMLTCSENGTVVNQQDGMTLKGITLKNVETLIDGQLKIEGLAPLSVSVDLSPVSISDKYELRIEIQKEGAAVTDLSTLRSKDIINATAHVYDKSTGDEVDPKTLPANTVQSMAYLEDGKVVTSSQTLSLTGLVLKEVPTEIDASLQIDSAKPLTASVTFTPKREVVYGLKADPSTGYTVDRSDIGDDIDGIRFIITADGVPITKEQSKDIQFRVETTGGVPYTLKQDDDGSYVFRPAFRWPALFYPTGDFSVKGILNEKTSETVQFAITASHLLMDIWNLFWPLVVLLYLIYYATKKRFPSGYLVERTYFIAGRNINPSGKNEKRIGPLTGAWQLWNHACTTRFDGIQFIAGGRNKIYVQTKSIGKNTKYCTTLRQENNRDILHLYNDPWDPPRHEGKQVLGSTEVLYIKSDGVIRTYYFKKNK